MRLTRADRNRVLVLATISLLVVLFVVFRSIGSNDDAAAPAPAATTAPDVTSGPSAADQVADSAATTSGEVDPTPTPGLGDRPVDELPASGPGTFTGALTGPVQFGPVEGAEVELQFSVAVEDDVGVDATELAAFVDQTLADPRSWGSDGRFSMTRVPSGGDFQLVVASPATTDQLCAPLQTIGQLSCAHDGVVAVNLIRWESGSLGWPTDLETYRAWVVNHEVGHVLLGPTHQPCPGDGLVAPVMQQQSIDLDGCEPNPWPFPDGPPADTSDDAADESEAPADDTG